MKTTDNDAPTRRRLREEVSWITRPEAVLFDALHAAGRRGLTLAEIHETDRSVSVARLRPIVGLYVATGDLEPAGACHRIGVRLGRKAGKFRITRRGRARVARWLQLFGTDDRKAS